MTFNFFYPFHAIAHKPFIYGVWKEVGLRQVMLQTGLELILTAAGLFGQVKSFVGWPLQLSFVLGTMDTTQNLHKFGEKHCKNVTDNKTT